MSTQSWCKEARKLRKHSRSTCCGSWWCRIMTHRWTIDNWKSSLGTFCRPAGPAITTCCIHELFKDCRGIFVGKIEALFSPVSWEEECVRLSIVVGVNGYTQKSNTSSGGQVSSLVFTSLFTRISILGFAYRILGKSSFRKWLWIHLSVN